MSIAHFDDLIAEARRQPDPQRLLFVFTRVSAPDDPTPAQRAAFEAGQGGALEPLAYVDKTLDEIDGFAALSAEAEQVVPGWAVVFVGALAGRHPMAPTSEQAEGPLNQMVEMIKAGTVGALAAFDTHGQAMQLHGELGNFDPEIARG